MKEKVYMTQQPNIIVLILDTLRASHVSSYGYPVKTTPNLDAFAAENILFRRAISAATWTVPSHACLLSGLHISQHRIETIKGDRQFNEAIVTLPAALSSQGYRTAAFSQNMLFSPNNHLDKGFDEFHGVEELLSSRLGTRLVKRLANNSPEPIRQVSRYLRKMIAPSLVLDSMLEWIKARTEKSPFFLFTNILAPHFPWTVPPRVLLRSGFNPKYLLKPDFVTLKKQWEFNSGKRRVTDQHRRVWRQLYDASILHVDAEIGRFLNRLRQLKGWENTIVVVTADHGELMGDYRDIVGHMLCLHDNLIHVPLIVRHPDYRKGMVVEGVVQTLDLYPSILEWAGCPTAGIPSAQVRRPPLSSVMAAPHDPSGLAFSEEDYTDSYDVIDRLLEVNPTMDPRKVPRQQVSVRSATHKYIWYNDRPADFYNLSTDPGEEQSLIDAGTATDQAALKDLQDALHVWRSGLEVFPPQAVDDVAEMDAATMDRLRGLGYVA
jgi:arylsulfatase A-like enzyme